MAAAAHSRRIPDDRALALRFAGALAVSACAHLILLQAPAFESSLRTVRLMREGTLSVRIASPVPAAVIIPEIGPAATEKLPRAGSPDSRHAAAPAVRAVPGTDAVTARALPQAPDPTYYSARDLDVYPRPAEPLDFDRFGQHLTGDAAGGLRAVLLIDEGGVVNRIEMTEAGLPGRSLEEARAALAAARFIPGQKNGRAVRSRVELSVTFDSARAAAAGR